MRAEGEFKIFSGGGWEFLFGKPLLHHFKALHNFNTDTVVIQSAHKSITLHNDAGKNAPTTPKGVSLMIDVEQQKDLVGGSSDVNPPSRQVPYTDISGSEVQNDKLGFISGDTDVLLREADEDIRMKIDSSTGEEECIRMTEEDHMVNSIPQKHREDEQNAGDQKEQRNE